MIDTSIERAMDAGVVRRRGEVLTNEYEMVENVFVRAPDGRPPPPRVSEIFSQCRYGARDTYLYIDVWRGNIGSSIRDPSHAEAAVSRQQEENVLERESVIL